MSNEITRYSPTLFYDEEAKRMVPGNEPDPEGEYMLYADREKWIPVSERLPDKNKWVYIFGKPTHEKHLRYELGAWEGAQWNHNTVMRFEEVTHWQPLPPPPEE